MITRKLFFCFFVLTSLYYSLYSNSNKDSILFIGNKISINHEILSPFIYPLIIGGNSISTKVESWKYLTGGLNYALNKKYSIGLSYLFYEKQVISRNSNADAQPIFGSFINSSINIFAQNHTYQQFYSWLSVKHNFKKWYVSCGFGVGFYTYKNNNINNAISAKNNDWCNVIDIGYKFKIGKRISFTPYIGNLTAFSYKKTITYSKPAHYVNSENYNNEIKSFDFKSINVEDDLIYTRRYKYLGIMQTKIIPRVGLNIAFNF